MNPLYDILQGDVEKLGAWGSTATQNKINFHTERVQRESADAAEKRAAEAAAAQAAANTAATGDGHNHGSSGGGGTPWQWNPNSGPIDKSLLTTINTKAGKVTVAKEAAAAFKGFLNELETKGYDVKSLGGYNPRKMRSNANAWSSHAGGYAIDINPATNPVTRNGKVITDMPPWVNSLARKYNLAWGGAWKGPTFDPMHFSYKIAR